MSKQREILQRLRADRFKRQLERGKKAEWMMANYLLDLGIAIFPVYEIENWAEHGPRLLMPGKRPVPLPDIFAVNLHLVPPFDTSLFWMDVKLKGTFGYYNGSTRTGIDTYVLNNYLQISRMTEMRAYVAFVHETGNVAGIQTKNEELPGVYVGEVEQMYATSQPNMVNGMSYWDINSLNRLCAYSELPTPEEMPSTTT